jgi:formyl-CoA transferase
LVKDCDVFVTNQPLPMRRSLKLCYEDLAPLNERMIYASLTPYGETGPDSDLEGFDGVAWWGRSGLMDLVRAHGAPPGGSVPGMGDHPSAVSLYAAIVTALLRRTRTGKGGLVHTSLFANGLWANACYAQAALVGADFAPVKAPRAPGPNRSIFETKDGRLLQLYMVRTQDELDGLLIAAGRVDLLDDPRFGDQAARPNHLAELVDILRPMFRERAAAEWMAIFRESGVPVSLVAEMPDLASDPQIRAAGIVGPPSDPSVPADLVLNHPLNIEGLGRVGPTHAPEIGEHTPTILSELGFSDSEIEAFRERGVV